MDAEKPLPTAAFRLNRVYAAEQEQRLVPTDIDKPLPAEPKVTIGWDWQFSEERTVEVLVKLELSASAARLEEVTASLAGSFSVSDGTSDAELLSFVFLNAPAILFPYVRETVTGLTARGPFGAYILPVMNVAAVMKDMSQDIATGAQQLRERRSHQPD